MWGAPGVVKVTNPYYTRLKNIKNVKRGRDGMPKVCEQGRDDA